MLYIIATPIGNLGDISNRALETLKSVDVIACEDTRNTVKLLSHYKLSKPLIAYHKFNELASTDGIVKLLREGKNVALVSDGGTPLISDPGNILTKRLKEENIDFTVIPGANAALSALLLSGLDSSRFSFVGFLPEKNSEIEKLLNEVSKYKSTLIFHVSPHSLKKDIDKIAKIMKGRKACLVAEITKIHERTIDFVLGEDIDVVEKGEFILVCEGTKENENENELCELTIPEHIDFYVCQGYSKNEAIKKVAKDRKVDKNTIYMTSIKSE